MTLKKEKKDTRKENRLIDNFNYLYSKKPFSDDWEHSFLFDPIGLGFEVLLRSHGNISNYACSTQFVKTRQTLIYLLLFDTNASPQHILTDNIILTHSNTINTNPNIFHI